MKISQSFSAFLHAFTHFRKGILLTAIVALLAWTGSAAELKRRIPFPKPSRAQITALTSSERAMLKLVEGSGVRLRGGRLIVEPQRVSDRLARTGIGPAKLPSRVAQINVILARHQVRVQRLFSREEAKADEKRAAGEKNIGEELGDLNLYYLLEFKKIDDGMIDALEELNELDVVEEARPVLKATVTGDKLPPATPLLTSEQDYLLAAPAGINAQNMSSIAGGLGQGITIADVEVGWTVQHEDLPPFLWEHNNNTDPDDVSDRRHGTAVLGELVGLHNGYGIDGIAPEANIAVSGVGPGENTADAIAYASDWLLPGDVMLVEMMVACESSSFKGCPAEFAREVYDAIKDATAAGQIVVEAAGNGGWDLDSVTMFGIEIPGTSTIVSRFDPDWFDSGAIMVGAGTSTTHARWSGSNFGRRVNAQGWGENVATTGGKGPPCLTCYCLFCPLVTPPTSPPTLDDQQKYTHEFDGTSSASPMVTGAAAVIQGVRKARNLPLLTSTEMRDAVIVGATPQDTSSDTGNIGPLPNLGAAVAALPPPPPVTTAVGSSTSVHISWPAVLVDLSSYEIHRKTTIDGSWQLRWSGTSTSWTDTGVNPNTTYMYVAVSLDALGNRSPLINGDLATTISYTDSSSVLDDPMQQTTIKAEHVVELRKATNALCAFAAGDICTTSRFDVNATTVSSVRGQPIRASDFTDIRYWDEYLLNAMHLSAATFSETVAPGMPIKKNHVKDLRGATE